MSSLDRINHDNIIHGITWRSRGAGAMNWTFEKYTYPDFAALAAVLLPTTSEGIKAHKEKKKEATQETKRKRNAATKTAAQAAAQQEIESEPEGAGDARKRKKRRSM